MESDESEDELLRSVALLNAGSVLAARIRAEQELVRIKEALEEETQSLELLNRTIGALASLELDNLVHVITDAAKKLGGAEFGMLCGTIVPTTPRVVLATSSIDALAARLELACSASPCPEIVMISDASIDALPSTLDASHRELVSSLSVRSYLVVPVASRRGQLFGNLMLGHRLPSIFGERAQRLVMGLAAQAAVALENARLYEESKRTADEMRVRARHSAMVAKVSSALASGAPLVHKLREICGLIVDDLDAALVRVWTFDPHDRMLELQATAGRDTGLDCTQRRVALGSTQVGSIAETRQPILTNDVMSDPKTDDLEWARLAGVVSFAGYPMVVDGQLMGVIAMFSTTPLSHATFVTFGETADRVSLGIDRHHAEEKRADADRFRELFIGMLGHDLRNPLSAVLAGVDLLEAVADLPPAAPTSRLAEHLPRTLKRIRNSADRMSRMIDQILDFTRLRVGNGIPVARRPCDIHDICREVADELQSSFANRLVQVHCSGDGSGWWDFDRLSQVFSNLIGNALVYGADCRPVRVVVQDEEDQVTITISNEGPEIPSDLLPIVFDPFRRARNAKSKGAEGLGLGLYITRQILIAHGGTIDVTSADGVTEFTGRLPRREAVHVGM